jgi:L-rhamnonate dehydratase
MAVPTIREVRAFVTRGGCGDYHDQGKGHWIDDHISTPMARHPEYRAKDANLTFNLRRSAAIAARLRHLKVNLPARKG